MKGVPSQRQLLWLQASQGFAIQLIFSVLYPFLRQHFSFAELSLQSMVQYSLPLFLLPFIRVFWIKRFIVFAFVLSILRMIVAPGIDTSLELYSAAVLAGAYLVFFWVPYELVYFRARAGNGVSSAWYFGVMSVVGIFGPIIAGLTADHLGYNVLFGGAALLMLIPLFLASRLLDERVNAGLGESLLSVRGIRHLLFFDGFFFSMSACLFALSLLTFTKTATDFGAITGVAALVATLTSFGAAGISDRKGDRFTIIAVTSGLLAVLTFALGFQTSFWWFSLLLVVHASIRTIAQPLLNALPMDLRPDREKLYVARQFLLSAGRVLGFGMTWLCALTVGLRPMYVAYALGFVVYIFCVKRVLSHRA